MRQILPIVKSSFQWALILFTTITMITAWTYMGEARPFRLGVLPDKGQEFGCSTCHVDKNGGGPRTPFGEDYARIGIKAKEKYTQALGELDSDGDTFTNDQEFEAGTHPGLVTSQPSK